MILTVLEDATEVTQAVAEGAPIPILQLFVQHLCPPVKVKKKYIYRSIQTWKSILGNYAFIINLLGKQDGGVSKAVRTLHFSTPIPLCLADILCTYDSELIYRCR